MKDEVVVVSGLPRSGTSMMMRRLAAGGVPILTDGERAADESNPEGYFEYERVKTLEKDASWLPLARGKAVKVVSELLRHLPAGPDYRVIFMMRRIEEVVVSQSRMLTRRGLATPDPAQDERMRGLLLQSLDRVTRWLETAPGFLVLYVSYNQVFAKGREHAERVNGFLGGGLDVARMTEVVNPALYRERR